jgi:hypothetical protein
MRSFRWGDGVSIPQGSDNIPANIRGVS